MQLEEQLGNFVTLADIPSNSLIWEKTDGYIPLSMLNTMYSVCMNCISGKRFDLNKLSMEIPYTDIQTALKNFKVFNIVQDVDFAVCNNIQKSILEPVRVHADLKPYIKKVANKYLKYRRQQLDCDYILTAFDSELFLFTDSAEIDIGAPYTSHTTFRSTAKPNKRTYIFNEVAALKRLKQIFEDIFDRMKKLVYILQDTSLKFRDTVKPSSDIDLEL